MVNLYKEIDSTIVKNEHNEDVWVIGIEDDENRKNYDNVDVVFRGTAKSFNVLQIGSFISGYTHEDDKAEHNSKNEVKFAFPWYGGVVLVVKKAGGDLTQYAYGLLGRVVAKKICEIVSTYYRYRIREQDTLNEIMKKIETMITVVEEETDNFLKTVREPSKYELSLNWYEVIKKTHVA